MKTRDNQPIETLRLNDRDKAKLLWAIEQANSRDDVQEQRRLRVACTNNEAVLTLKNEAGSETQLSMLARNLSRWGAALVHGRYMHAGSRCELEIQANNGVWQKMLGTVRHIRHIQGTIHELGVAFDEPIDLSEFVSLTAEEETQYLRELADDLPEADENEAINLTNRVLVVDDFSCDRKLLSHWLNQAGLTVTTTSDIRSARVQVQEQAFDLLLIDHRLGNEFGTDLIKELRQGQFNAPIIAMSADESDEIKSDLLDAGATRFMKKPLDAEKLKQAAFELIRIDASSDMTPIFSTHKDDVEMRPLVTAFTRGLTKYVDELRDANAQNNYETIELISHHLKGAGDGYGFPAISEQAAALLQSLSNDAAEVEKIRDQASDLIAILNRVKLS